MSIVSLWFIITNITTPKLQMSDLKGLSGFRCNSSGEKYANDPQYVSLNWFFCWQCFAYPKSANFGCICAENIFEFEVSVGHILVVNVRQSVHNLFEQIRANRSVNAPYLSANQLKCRSARTPKSRKLCFWSSICYTPSRLPNVALSAALRSLAAGIWSDNGWMSLQVCHLHCHRFVGLVMRRLIYFSVIAEPIRPLSL